MEYLSQVGFENLLNQWSDADPNISSNGFGSLYNVNGESKAEQKYPGMWCQPQSTSVQEWVVTRSYQILIYDLIFTDNNGDNINRVISDCEEYAFRLIRFLKTKSDIFNIDGIPTVRPFTDRFVDDVSGVIIDLTVEFNGESSNCNDPNYDFEIKKNNI
jgi:hypothetical protein